jgi:hypothetical protein
MQTLDGIKYNCSIPPYPLGTNVTYMITAQDYANNTVSTDELGFTLQYDVIPELPVAILAPTLVVATLTAALAARRRRRRQ